MSKETTQEFGKLRSIFWPVYSYELKKILPMFMMFFFILFNYTVLRDTKDTLIVTAAGAEAIPFLKVWGVVPSAVIFVLIYAKMSNIFSKEKLFYVTLTPFIVFFALFTLVLYPNKDLLHPTVTADYLETILPGGWKGLAGAYRNWTYSLFYVLSELWGSAVLSLMFWGFANDIMRVTEAKRFYTLIGPGGNIALMFSGPLIYYFSTMRGSATADVDAWQTSLNYLMGMVVFGGVMIMAIYWWMQRNILTDPRFYDPKDVKKKKEKTKLGIVESFKFLFTSKYVLCIALLVICYGICINLVEVTWKGQLKLQFPNPNEYSAFMGQFSFFTGCASVLMMFVAGYILRKKGWGFAAMATPMILLLTGIGFFAFVIFRDNLSGYVALLGSTPLFLAVIIGMVQNIMSKSTKYTLFDPTKEISYIPLDDESKVKGKAAIDVVGARLGKSGGSIIYQVLFAFGTLATVTPIVAGLMVVTIFVWMAAVRSLNKQFVALTGEKAPVKKAPEGATAQA